MSKVLDLGCGPGSTSLEQVWGVNASDEVSGIDIDANSLEIARNRFPHRQYHLASGETIPYDNRNFDRVISSVALNYMNIAKTLHEIHRVLVSGGSLSLSLHPVGFTMKEFKLAWPHPKALLFRVYVLLNGCFFHFSGRTIPFLTGKTEFWASERGMTIALRDVGFRILTFSHRPGKTNWMLIVEAVKQD